jgi:hypothetical protein
MSSSNKTMRFMGTSSPPVRDSTRLGVRLICLECVCEKICTELKCDSPNGIQHRYEKIAVAKSMHLEDRCTRRSRKSLSPPPNIQDYP